jgi:hypothetical protein
MYIWYSKFLEIIATVCIPPSHAGLDLGMGTMALCPGAFTNWEAPPLKELFFGLFTFVSNWLADMIMHNIIAVATCNYHVYKQHNSKLITCDA